MADDVYNILFLCTGNSARSILAECLAERWGRGRFRGFSAGSHPKGEVHPLALEILRHNNYVTDGLRSKDWSEFAGPNAPRMDFVFTVCDKAAAEVCPVWPGQPMTAHWGVADPAAAEGNEVTRMMAFRTALHELENRISIFVNLPFASLDRLKLQEKLKEIGRIRVGEQETSMPTQPPSVLILCTGNSCRSQMAQVILAHDLAGQVRALSAGIEPQPKVADNAIAALREGGRPADGLYPKDIDIVIDEPFDLVVTVCDNAKESCPIFPRPVPQIHLPFHDPHGEPLESFIRVRDEIRARLVPAVVEALKLNQSAPE